jgi:hypothetical protein
MIWKEAELLIRHNIIIGMKLDNRTVLEGPDYQCPRYDYARAKGYKVKIGRKTSLDIPFIMLQSVFEDAIANNRIYENMVFRKKFNRQYKVHGCHVHVIGRIFEKSGVATQVDKRKYKIK